MTYLEQTAIIIPSLNPDQRMIDLIQNLKNAGFQLILIVNDGSSRKYAEFYDKAANDFGCKVLEHAINLGKGRALKTAFNYIITHWHNCTGAVTVDSDGQHSVQDIIRCMDELYRHQDCLILGSRDFSSGNVPFRSKAGNIITRQVLSMLCGISLSDTQTGLRGLSQKHMMEFLDVSGERFEYEMNMLIHAKEKKIRIMEIPIQTIYLENNKSSHFNPLTDSIKIYAMFFKFVLSAISSFAIDAILFVIFNAVFRNIIPDYYIIISTIIARIFSSIYNFTMNKNNVFQSKDNTKSTVIKYYVLCLLQMIASATGVTLLYKLLHVNEVIIKILVDFVLFLLGYRIQMKWVFHSKE